MSRTKRNYKPVSNPHIGRQEFWDKMARGHVSGKMISDMGTWNGNDVKMGWPELSDPGGRRWAKRYVSKIRRRGERELIEAEVVEAVGTDFGPAKCGTCGEAPAITIGGQCKVCWEWSCISGDPVEGLNGWLEDQFDEADYYYDDWYDDWGDYYEPCYTHTEESRQESNRAHIVDEWLAGVDLWEQECDHDDFHYIWLETDWGVEYEQYQDSLE